VIEKLNKAINVLLVEESSSVRKALKYLLNSKDHIKVTAESGDARYALQLINEGFDGVVVMGMNLPDLTGVETIQKIKQERPELPVIVVSFQTDIRYMRECFKAGASDYVLIERANEELPEVILKAVNRTSFT
jgi:DNA-binding NarL/FixJ family response regulator